MPLASTRQAHWSRAGLAVASLAVITMALLWTAAGARSAELLYWNNYQDDPASIGNSNLDGSSGGALNVGSVLLEDPEGMTIDTAGNRLFVANAGEKGSNGKIVAINLDGSGAAVFSAPGAPVDEPEGIAIDPNTQTVYWINDNTASPSIGFAKLDGSVGGVLNTAGAPLTAAYRLTIDPAGGRLYWGNIDGPEVVSIAYAKLDNSGGGTLDVTGAAAPKDVSGLAVDPIKNKLYWVDTTSGSEHISYANLSGGGGGNVNYTGATLSQAYGLALDPSIGRLYWGNYQANDDRAAAFSFSSVDGGGGTFGIATAPLNAPQDPVILKSPTGTGAPGLTRNAKVPSELTCSAGTWAADFAGSFVFQAPRTFAYQWTRNGKPVAGATAATLAAKSAGSYACVVTAGNQAGTGAQTSAATSVKAAKFKLTAKKARVKAGGVATFKVKAVNQGDLKSGNAKVCVKLTKATKKFVKAPKCKALGKVKSKGKDSAKLKLKVAAGAKPGTYGVTFSVRGGSGKAAKTKLVVLG